MNAIGKWDGKWTPLRIDSVPKVVQEVQDFVDIYRGLKEELEKERVAEDAIENVQSRLRRMLKSAQLRLDILTHFYLQNKKDLRSDRVKGGIRALKTLLSDEDVEDDPFMQEGAAGIAADDADDAHNLRADNDVNNDVVEVSPAKQEAQEEALRVHSVKAEEQIRQLTDKVVSLTCRLEASAMEKHACERSLLELCEARERMKAIVEEQIYTITLMTKISSLLHMELRRILFRTVARGILFWSVSFVCTFHSLNTGGANILRMYSAVRAYFDNGDGFTWYGLFVDLLLVSVLFALMYEWASFAQNDIEHGAGSWCLDSVITARDDAMESARVEAIRQAEQMLATEYIPLGRVQELDANATQPSQPPNTSDPSDANSSKISAPRVGSGRMRRVGSFGQRRTSAGSISIGGSGQLVQTRESSRYAPSDVSELLVTKGRDVGVGGEG